MKLPEIIEQLSNIVKKKPPAKAILAAKENWNEFLPVITELMNKFQEESLTEKEYTLLTMGLMLLVEMREHDQFEAFVTLCDGDDDYSSPLGDLWGDAITEDLSSYFYILANGRYKPLEILLFSKICGGYIRNAALDAVFAQYESKQISEEALADLVDRLIVTYKEQEDFYLLGSLCDLLINYQWKTYQATFLTLAKEDYLESFSFSQKSLETWQAQYKNEELLASGQIKQELDTIKDISGWVCYRPEPPRLKNKKKFPSIKTPVVSQSIKVGRNEPCPCGSGKKYKKCCA